MMWVVHLHNSLIMQVLIIKLAIGHELWTLEHTLKLLGHTLCPTSPAP